MLREVKSELLDQLSALDPRALGSRRDIHRINGIMGNAGSLNSLIRRCQTAAPRRIVELGAGDGRFMLRLARQFAPHWRGAHIVLVDNKSVVDETTRAGFEALHWSISVVESDVFDWLRQPGDGAEDVIICNLFLHQFAEPDLEEMLELAAARSRLFAACEPWRSQPALLCSRALGLIGCNDVTRHDAVASVRAGFRGRELSRLWPKDSRWRLLERSARMFTHTFVAERMDGNKDGRIE